MSGHSKWKQIKHKKAKSDAERSKIFTKYAKLLTQEAKRAKGSLTDPGLKAAIDRAKSENMPNDSIERAIKKATTANSASLEAITYEAYGPGGCALIIEALTENRNKAAQEVKHILSDRGFALAGIGTASWAFSKTAEGWLPNTTIPLSPEDEQILEGLIEALEDNDEVQQVFTNAE